MNFRGILIFLILSAILYFLLPKINEQVEKRMEKKVDLSNFTVRKSRALRWIASLSFFILGGVLTVVLIYSDNNSMSDYAITFFTILLTFTLMVWMLFYKLEFKEGEFYYRPIFGRSKRFTLKDISDLSYTENRQGVKMITLYSGKDMVAKEWKFITLYIPENELALVYSTQEGYGAMLKLLQKEGFIGENPVLDKIH